jgi:hypothetical protein
MSKYINNKNTYSHISKSLYNKDDYYVSKIKSSTSESIGKSTFNITDTNLNVSTLTASDLIHSFNKITTTGLILQNNTITNIGLSNITFNGIVDFTKDINIGTMLNTDILNNTITFDISTILNLGNYIIDGSTILNNTSDILLKSSNNIFFEPKVGGNITIDSLTNSSSVITGALIVKGGVGIAGNVYSTNSHSINLYATTGNITNLIINNLTINSIKFYDIFGSTYSFISPNLDNIWNDIVITPKSNTSDILYQFGSNLMTIKNSLNVNKNAEFGITNTDVLIINSNTTLYNDVNIGEDNTDVLIINSNTTLYNDVNIGEDNTDTLTINSTTNTNILTCSNNPLNNTDVLRLQDVKINFTEYTKNYYYETTHIGTINISAICDINNIVNYSINNIDNITSTNNITYIKIEIPNIYTPYLNYSYYVFGNNGLIDNKILKLDVKTDNTIIITPIFDISNNINNSIFEIGSTYSIHPIFISYLKN